MLPDGGKEARASSVAHFWESGSVWIPHPKVKGWVEDFVQEMTVFPKGAHDDQVDAMTQALNRLRVSKVEALDIAAFDTTMFSRVNEFDF